METRTCRVCGEEKPITDFYLNRRWRSHRCKACHCSWRKAYRVRNRERECAYDREYKRL